MNRNRVNSLLSNVDPFVIAVVATLAGVGLGLLMAQPMTGRHHGRLHGRLQQLRAEVDRLAAEVQSALRR